MAEKNHEESRTEGFGEYLKRQRELRGFTLEEIAEQTKISLRALRALEAEDWDVLPADVYVRGFVRCYAEAIGLDPNEALVRYEKAVSPFRRQRNAISGDGKYLEETKKRSYTWVVLLLLLLAVLIGIYFLLTTPKTPKPRSSFSTLKSVSAPLKPTPPADQGGETTETNVTVQP